MLWAYSSFRSKTSITLAGASGAVLSFMLTAQFLRRPVWSSTAAPLRLVLVALALNTAGLVASAYATAYGNSTRAWVFSILGIMYGQALGSSVLSFDCCGRHRYHIFWHGPRFAPVVPLLEKLIELGWRQAVMYLALATTCAFVRQSSCLSAQNTHVQVESRKSLGCKKTDAQ